MSNNKLSPKKTSYGWSKLYKINFIDIRGFDNEDFFNKVYISADDFLNRAALCEVEKPNHISRREASKLKKKFLIFGS